MRYVENQSKTFFPHERKRYISHTYLRKLEEGQYETPSPIKLKTLARIYGIDYPELLALADYVESKAAPTIQTQGSPEKKTSRTNGGPLNAEIVRKLRHHLETNGVRAEYFFSALLSLSRKSLSVINRLVSVMSVQERDIRRKPESHVTLQGP